MWNNIFSLPKFMHCFFSKALVGAQTLSLKLPYWVVKQINKLSSVMVFYLVSHQLSLVQHIILVTYIIETRSTWRILLVFVHYSFKQYCQYMCLSWPMSSEINCMLGQRMGKEKTKANNRAYDEGLWQGARAKMHTKYFVRFLVWQAVKFNWFLKII